MEQLFLQSVYDNDKVRNAFYFVLLNKFTIFMIDNIYSKNPQVKLI